MAEAALQARVAELEAEKDALLVEQRELKQNVFRVNTKLPSFWSDKPAVWFSQAEAQFTINKITSEKTRYQYVVAQLDTRVAAEVEDVLTGPVENQIYTFLKNELISRLSLSEDRRVRKLIQDEEMGDRTPSQFLRYLRSLATNSAAISEPLLKQLWLQRLPHTASAILTSQPALDLSALAALADKIVEVAPAPVPAINAVSSKSDIDFPTLVKMVSDLQTKFASMEHGRRDREDRSRSRSHSRNPARDSRKSNIAPTVCWYHEKYADKAQKCVSPCSFQQGNAHGNQ